MEEYVFTYKYTEQDLLEFLNWQLYKKAHFRLYQIFFLILLILQIGFSLLIGYVDYIWLGLFVFLFLTIFVLLPLLLKYNVKKQFRTNPYFQYDITYTLNNEYLVQASEHTQTKCHWKDLYLAGESDTYFYLFISNQLSLIIPKDNLNEHIDEFRNILKISLDDKKCKYLYK